MAVVKDDDPGEAFFAHRAHPPFRIGIGSGSTKGRAHHFKTLGLKDGIEHCTIFAIIIAQHMCKPPFLCVAIPHELAGLLGNPALGWLGSDP